MHAHSFWLSLSLPLVHLSRAASINSRQSDLIISTDLPSGWSYKGCYVDSVSNRLLSASASFSDTSMTQEACIGYCSSAGFAVAGVEYSRECFCGYSLSSSAALGEEDTCNMPCTGDASEKCGGPNRLNIFSTASSTSDPTTNPGPDGWQSLGCYTDSVSARTLTTSVGVPESGNSVASCTATCKQRGFAYAGVEFGRECFCGGSISNGGAPATDGCNMPCTGNPTELCGGASRINIYKSTAAAPTSGEVPDNWQYSGCYPDNVADRALSQRADLPGDSLTVEACVNYCAAQPNTYFAGLEYASECYCGSYIASGPINTVPSGCDMACTGNTAEICGGAARLSLYSYNPSPPSFRNGNFDDGIVDGAPTSWTVTSTSNSYTAKVVGNYGLRSGNTANSLELVSIADNAQIVLSNRLRGLTPGRRYSIDFYQGRTSYRSYDFEREGLSYGITTADGLYQAGRTSCTGTDTQSNGGRPPCDFSGAGGSDYQNVPLLFTATDSTTFNLMITNAQAGATLLLDSFTVTPA